MNSEGGTFVTTVVLLLILGTLVLRARRVTWRDGFHIIACSVCLFAAGYWFVGGAIGRIPSVDRYIVKHGLVDTPREEAIYSIPAAVTGLVCFSWMLRKHLTNR